MQSSWAAEKFHLNLYFICIHNFLIKSWSRIGNSMAWSYRCNALQQNFHLYCLFWKPEHKRAVIKACPYTIYEIMQIWFRLFISLRKQNFFCLSLHSFVHLSFVHLPRISNEIAKRNKFSFCKRLNLLVQWCQSKTV